LHDFIPDVVFHRQQLFPARTPTSPVLQIVAEAVKQIRNVGFCVPGAICMPPTEPTDVLKYFSIPAFRSSALSQTGK
jgi:hypothetical protein